MKSSILVSVLFLLFSFSCGSPDSANKPKESPGIKTLRVAADESYRLLCDAEIYTFQSLHGGIRIESRFLSEHESLEALLDDSVKIAIINHPLTDNEREKFSVRNLFPTETKIAEDGIALVINKENPDSTFLFEQISLILSGRDSTWKQLNSKSKLDGIRILFDNPNSSNSRYIRDFSSESKLPKNAFAVRTNPQVIEYVSAHKNAIGVISVNWISDPNDSISRGFLRKVTVAGISKAGQKARYYKPYQAHIKTRDYPFCRNVYLISRQTSPGLGMEFAHFISSDRGQRIVLKMGLVPAIAPPRELKLRQPAG